MTERMAQMDQRVIEPAHWTRPDVPARLGPTASIEPSAPDERARRAGAIRRLVEADVLPRVRPELTGEPGASEGYRPEVLHLVDLLLASDEAAAKACVASLRSRGVSDEAICLDLLQPAARRIGDLWCDDLCSFVDVTLATAVLHRIVEDNVFMHPVDGHAGNAGRTVLLTPLPGEQHTFGLVIVADFFRRAGWQVDSHPAGTGEALGHAVGATAYAVIGFSTGSDVRLDDLRKAIGMVRRRSCNKSVKVLVGGPLFVEKPDYAVAVGADGMGGDARQAVARAEAWLTNAGSP